MSRPTKMADVTKDSGHHLAFLGKVADDEPIFILRGRDALAGSTIAAWIELAKDHDVNPEKIAAAEAHLDLFDDYAVLQATRLPD